MGCGAFVDGDEVLPVVEDVGANLLGDFHGGCAEDNYVIREGVGASSIQQGYLVGIRVAIHSHAQQTSRAEQRSQ